MCIELTLKEGCVKVHVAKAHIVFFKPAKDHEKGSDVGLSCGHCVVVEECPTEVHELLHKE